MPKPFAISSLQYCRRILSLLRLVIFHPLYKSAWMKVRPALGGTLTLLRTSLSAVRTSLNDFAQITFRRFLPNARFQSDVLDSVQRTVKSSDAAFKKPDIFSLDGAEAATGALTVDPKSQSHNRGEQDRRRTICAKAAGILLPTMGEVTTEAHGEHRAASP